MDVAVWLRGLGLERYEAAFRDNEIDWDALPKLTTEDLKDLGVVLGGHRRKLLEAIAALRSQVDATPEQAAAAPTAERRLLTVMFCDLVGSTALAARLDPEDLREVINEYLRVVANVVGKFDGFVARYMGDGCSPISATRERMRMMRSARCGPASPWSRRYADLKVSLR
jgi:class 3 adenylate cyclase